MSARRWPTGRLTFREPPCRRRRWSSTLSVLLWCLLAVLVLGVAIPALWAGR